MDKEKNINPEFKPLSTPETFQSHVNELAKPNENIGIFSVKTANKWIDEAKKRPIPKMLFSELWFEGELCILFADTGMGKSILAVQIGNSISRGNNIPGFRFEANKQLVLYCDFELSDKQFENRYSIDYSNHYVWDENFYRIEINPESEIPQEYKTFEDYLNFSIEQTLIETGAKILIIDNITYLKSETERAKDALPLMKHLKKLKNKYNLSILALAHTPKRDLTKPITRNDLQGSKMLINFCDSSFTIGESSQDTGIRYLKQIKERFTSKIYDSENVVLCELDKPDNFLRFEFMGFSKESEHLRYISENDMEAMKARVIELKEQGKSYRDIGNELGFSHMKAQRLYEKCNKV
jgi:RecA-family ATPase